MVKVKSLTMEVTCFNCISAKTIKDKYFPYEIKYRCRNKNGTFEKGSELNKEICHHWKPSVGHMEKLIKFHASE